MKRDAHYYAMLTLCRACGFNKESAQTIAYASQYVDDAKVDLIFFKEDNNIAEHDIVENKPAFFNMATCHSYFWIKTFNYEAMVNNTSAFHFVPGCRGENFTKKLRCKEESPVIIDILNDAIMDDDPVKLGMVLHSYADTFTHQGFSGMLSKVNDVKNCKAKSKTYLGFLEKGLHVFKRFSQEKYEEFFDSIVPAHGHGQAMDFPDLPYLIWSYEYDYSDEFNGTLKKTEIDNRERFKRAFSKIKQILEYYLSIHPQYADPDVNFTDFGAFLDNLVLESTDKKRERNWVNFLMKYQLFKGEELTSVLYDHNQWLKEAFANFDPIVFNNRVVDGAQLSKGFAQSSWYHFYLAVRWYKEKFFNYCSDYDLYIPN